MRNSPTFGRLSLYRPAQALSASVTPSGAQIFENLLEQAVPGARIDVFELPQAAQTLSPPVSGPGCAVVCCGRPLQFRCALPDKWTDGQALFFERDAEGAVALLSYHALLGGSVWYRRICETPRNDVMPSGGGPCGTIQLETPGRSTLLLICCRNRTIRYDQLKMFRRTASAKSGPLEVALVDGDDLCELRKLLARCERPDWAVIASEAEVLPEAAIQWELL